MVKTKDFQKLFFNIFCVPVIPGDLVVKSNISLRIGYASLRQLNLIREKTTIKLFNTIFSKFLNSSVKQAAATLLEVSNRGINIHVIAFLPASVI